MAVTPPSPPPAAGPVTACTVVSRRYLPYARVLASSLRRHDPGAELRALVVDDLDHQVGEGEPFTPLHLEDLPLGVDELHRRAMLFGPDFRAAVKPTLLRAVLATGVPSVLFVDSDIEVFAPLTAFAAAAAEHGVALAPHVLHPMPRDGLEPDESTVLAMGVYNAGLFGVGQGGTAFLDFLEERLRRECRIDVAGMRANEQKWLDFVPSLFDHAICRDHGVDVAYWNLHERPLGLRDGVWYAGPDPLRCFHYSGIEPLLDLAGRFELGLARVRSSADAALAALARRYRAAVVEAGYLKSRHLPFAFDHLADGTPVYAGLRPLFAAAVAEADAGRAPYPPDPYDRSSVTAFRAWAVDAYRRRGWRVPDLLAGSSAPAPFPPRLEHADVLSSMRTGPAGRDSDDGIRWDGGRGEVMVGPYAYLGAGTFDVTLELDAVEGPAGGAPGGLHVYPMVDDVVLGHRAVGAGELAGGSAGLEVTVPAELEDRALRAGLDLRVVGEGGGAATVTALRVARRGETAQRRPLEVAWLPALRVGDAAEVADGRLRTRPDRYGWIAYGPHWVLGAGHYRVTARWDGAPAGPTDPAAPALVLDVAADGVVLATTVVDGAGLARGEVSLAVAVPPQPPRHPGERVEVRLQSLVPLDATVHEVRVEEVTGAAAPGPPAGARPWLALLHPGPAGSRRGTALVATGPGELARGPYWRLHPGRYQLEVRGTGPLAVAVAVGEAVVAEVPGPGRVPFAVAAGADGRGEYVHVVVGAAGGGAVVEAVDLTGPLG